MKIIGIRPSSFSAREDESKQVSGKNIYVTYPLEKGEASAPNVSSSRTPS